MSVLTTLQPGPLISPPRRRSPACCGLVRVPHRPPRPSAVSGRPWAAFLVAIAAAIVISGLAEAVRRIRLPQVHRER